MSEAATPPVTRELARFAVSSSPGSLPAAVRNEGVRAFVNWMGCVIGGCREPVVLTALASLEPFAGSAQAKVVGHGARLDELTASYINSMSSGVHTFDDTHLKTVAHPTGPVASALFAMSERRTVSGEQFLAALAVGLEVACRLSSALFEPPARCHVGFSMTGLACGIGAAAACGALLGLDEEKMISALGIAAIQSAGFREAHQSGAAYLPGAQAARSGLLAAAMADRGLTCMPTSLEGRNGFLSVFAAPPNPPAAVNDLGSRFELLDLAYKPYPCGIVVHPSIDVCLDAAGRLPASPIERIELTVSPIAMSLARQPNPKTPFEAQVSIHHWAAAALLRRKAGLEEGRLPAILAPDIAALRSRVTVKGDPTLADDAARGLFTMAGGETVAIDVPHCRGSIHRPLSDAEIDEKFLGQAEVLYAQDEALTLLAACRAVAALDDVGGLARHHLD